MLGEDRDNSNGQEADVVVPDPGDLYEVDSAAPELDDVVLLWHFDGFIDAGAAGRLVAEHLLEKLDHKIIATFDVDRLIDYRSRRPVMMFARDHWESCEQLQLAVYLMHDAAGTPFLLLTGPEPDHEWERFTAAVTTLAQRLGVRLAAGFHGIPLGVPHTRPLGVTAHATRPEMVEGDRPLPSQLQVPGSVAALLEFRFGEAGRDAAGFAVHVPHYLAQAAYPAGAVRLLESVTGLTGLSIPDEALREAARRTDVEINRQVEASAEVTEVVQALEQQYDAAEAETQQGVLIVDPENMPTAEELGEQFERFLAEQQGPANPQDL
ncbi:MAG TPA: PAC2 family protein [Streptosporangiaceae bacterium]|jgi:predicted ATP-grasp superfamily ATP-dependent carboligase